jgi:hypothetical protein
MGAPGPAILGDTEVNKLPYFLNIRRDFLSASGLQATGIVNDILNNIERRLQCKEGSF